MRLLLATAAPLAALLALFPAVPADTDTAPPRAHGLEKRVPWTTSKVVGTPEPPPPYRVVRTFPNLKVPCPIAVAHEPGTKSLILVYQLFPWGGAGRVVRVADDPATDKADMLLELDGIAYGVAFHPDYLSNGYLYVGDNGPMEGKKKTRVTRYTVGRKPPHRIVPGSAKVIIEWDSDGHNGGDVAFGKDGMLYVTSGDGTSDSDTNLAGQDLTRLLSKVLRLDVDHPEPGKNYAVPKDNPFVGRAGTRPETWAYGFRNPWRIHCDRQTGDVWVGQNGQDLWEQVYLVQKGANYGWSVVEGSHPFYPDRKRGPEPIAPPIAEHHHSEFRSLTGGVVYRGQALPGLRDTYVYGDWSTGKIWGVRQEGGKAVWHQHLADSALQITGFGLDSSGELLICDHGGGALYRLEPTPPEKPAKFPTRLSETGLFRSVKAHEPEAGVVPYSVNAPLWSDGAAKERFLAVPGLEPIDMTGSRGWNFPDGTVLVKTFALDTPDGRRRVETRLLTKPAGQWVGYSYRWNDEQTDAVLVGRAGADVAFTVKDAAAPGGARRQTWHYPSRAECMVCHSRAANFVLGLSTEQMNRAHDYGGVSDEQLRALAHVGYFRLQAADNVAEARDVLRTARDAVGGAVPAPLRRPLAPLWTAPEGIVARHDPLAWAEGRLREAKVTSPLLPRRPEGYRRLVDPADATQPLGLRARSYLHANCAICHVLAGGGNAQIDLEFTTPRDKMNLVGVKALHRLPDVAADKLIEPGAPEKSLLYLRLTRRGAGQMPPLASSVVDAEATKMIAEWVRSLKPE
jgi:glucose/arabinose dehydrogenase